ncbi:MAG: hypothetical protein WB711_10195 [Terriglobales bacterium]
MENLKEKLEKTLEEHQRESGLHMIGGRERLVARLLKVLDPPAHGAANADYTPSDEDGRCCQ